MENHKLFHPFQSGFRRHHSCQTALTRLCDTWLSAINQGKITGAVFLDFKKAFDLVNHHILLKKLTLYLQNPTMVKFFKSYLQNRTQRVYLNGTYSTTGDITSGVPQGSILGPLLFCIFINDLPMEISSDVVCDLFADDSTLHCSSTQIQTIQSLLQHSIKDVFNWCNINNMSLNPQKTKSIVLTSRQKHQREPLELRLNINEDPIGQVTEHRVLGVILDQTLTWQSHISYVCKLLARNLFLLNRLRQFVDTDTRKIFFDAHCLSHINYASTIWSNACANQIKRVNSLHRRGAKLIFSGDSLSTTEKLNKMNILPLHSQLTYNKLILMYKAHTNLAPQYLSDLITIATKRYNSNKYILPYVRIDLFKSSFAFFGPSAWNSLPEYIKESRSLQSFKSNLRNFLLKENSL